MWLLGIGGASYLYIEFYMLILISFTGSIIKNIDYTCPVQISMEAIQDWNRVHCLSGYCSSGMILNWLAYWKFPVYVRALKIDDYVDALC